MHHCTAQGAGSGSCLAVHHWKFCGGGNVVVCIVAAMSLTKTLNNGICGGNENR